MALYHKGLKKHEDAVVKHSITKEEIEFLTNLQKEMNTQDTLAMADPRYWVIRDKKKDYVDDYVEDFDDCELFHCGIMVAENLKDASEYLNDIFEKEPYEFVYDDCKIKVVYNNVEVLRNMPEVVNWLSCNNFDNFSYRKYTKYWVLHNNIFLTQKAAEEHLRQNEHHYSDDAHTYGMVAWRSPDVEMLWKIIQSVQWGELLK